MTRYRLNARIPNAHCGNSQYAKSKAKKFYEGAGYSLYALEIT